MFEPSRIVDTEDTRTCGNCGESKHIDFFYKDGTNRDGTIKVRRDCKECYRVTRLKSRNAKKVKEEPKAKPRGRRKK